jgi:hypothetical protein
MCITFYKMIKKRPEELLIQLFHVYAEGGHRSSASRGRCSLLSLSLTPSLDDMYLPDKSVLPKIFLLPTITGILLYPSFSLILMMHT